MRTPEDKARRTELRTERRAPVWLSRPLLDPLPMFRWAEAAGVRKMLAPDHLHCTLATVRDPVDWKDLPLETEVIEIPAGQASLEIFGWTTKAFAFRHPDLDRRHGELARLFPSIDHPTLRAHMSLFKGGRMANLPFPGALRLGAERAVVFNDADAKGIKHVNVRNWLEEHSA